MSSDPSLQSTSTPISEIVKGLGDYFNTGITQTVQWRKEQLSALTTMLEEQEDEILQALAADIHKCTFEAYLSEILSVKNEAEEARDHVENWMRPEKVAMSLPGGIAASTRIVHDSLGTGLIIGAWNYPIMLTLGPLVGAIAGGNCALIKPSELVPECAALLSRIVPQYMDTQAFAVVEGGIPETTEILAQRFDHIFFTGSPPVAKIVMAAAAKHLTPVVLELGGKSPAIVCRDANLDTAARRVAWGKFFNAGQTCIGVDYALIDEEVYDEFLAKLTSVLADFYGPYPQQSPDYARIVNRANLDRIAAMLEGQEIVAGGQVDADDLYIAPTVLRDVAPEAAVMQDEIFGPLLPTMTFSDLQSAIDFVNSGEKPLAEYIFSSDSKTQDKIIDETSSGAVGVNETLSHILVPGAPFGGVGQSGMGAYHGYDGYLAYTHRRTVLTRSASIDPPVRYPPYSDLKAKLTGWLL